MIRTMPKPRRADGPRAFLAVLSARRLRGGTISPDAVSALAGAITTEEGYYPGSVSYQNNNPGNLVYAGQPGASPGVGGFAAFDTLADGQAALNNQITLDATRGTDVNGNPTTTVSQLLTSWAPPSENDTSSYISSVAAQTGYDPNAPLSSLGSADTTASMAPLNTLTDAIDSTDTGTDVSDLLSGTVDLSSLGIATPVPTFALLAAGLGVALLVSQAL